ncbi:hypothetical protein [Bradyrhizobium cenepequi]|uniref:hypothetical protein n=1 Tax=Bradyrhizobium cenepequi TaxID=2821403 RepID=UPI001CE334B3|nr:hypothetical protein [Bradyrhizobium cenepequi]MCA6108113.1 hypothetical protein [Bradyrhizobium cenepequi]
MITLDSVPDGMDYQLVTTALLGDASFSEVAKFEKSGWRRVPRERHPESVSDNSVWLEYGGQALMERPQYLTQRAREHERAKADAQIIDAIGGLHDAAALVAGAIGAQSGVMVKTLREIDPKAPKKAAKRKQNAREFMTLHSWRCKNWARNLFAGRE